MNGKSAGPPQWNRFTTKAEARYRYEHVLRGVATAHMLAADAKPRYAFRLVKKCDRTKSSMPC